jgi:TrmH family RNA methyltransferase
MPREPKPIQSRDNPQVKALLKLSASSAERRRTNTTLIEGERLLAAFRDAGGNARVIALSESAYAKPELRALVETTPAPAKLVLSDRLVEKISQVVTASGVIAAVETPKPAEAPREISGALLLEGIQDPGNLGSILRSAAAAGVRHVFLSRDSVFAWSPKVIRAGMGAHFSLSIHEDADLTVIARRCRGRIVATDPRAQASLYDLVLREEVAWLFGNEGAGLSRAALELASERVRIPMPGASESLNVAAAVAICLFEQVRQRAGADFLNTPGARA